MCPAGRRGHSLGARRAAQGRERRVAPEVPVQGLLRIRSVLITLPVAPYRLRTSDSRWKGIEIIAGYEGIPGYACPYVIDAPEVGGKITVSPVHLGRDGVDSLRPTTQRSYLPGSQT